jgi:hypothetical protein
MMSVLFSEPRSRARWKKPSAEFSVGIENGADRENREREREREAVDTITGIQRGQEVTARERERVFCRLARHQEHYYSPVDSLAM